ncbi:MAG: vWA domain-containing protein [Candidatus Bathyarchaeia archaeon]
MISKYNSKDWDIKFITKFFEGMASRVPKEYEDYLKSLRRRKTISNYLTALYMKDGKRLPNHYIIAAKYTLLPELQEIGERVAKEIVFDLPKRFRFQEQGFEKKSEGIEKMKLMADIMEAYGFVPMFFNKSISYKSWERFMSFLFGISGGPGRDRLLKWNEKTDLFSEGFKRLMHKAIKIGKRYFHKHSEKRGSSGTYLLRPFNIGDDPESIDYEETIENIYEQGKKLEHLQYEDILVRDSMKRLWSIVYLQDISGSMRPYISIMNLILSTLIQSFKNEVFAIGLFRDDFYIMKEIDENKDLEKLILNVLSLQPEGGTVLIKGLDWTKKQLNKAGKTDKKICFILSDFNFCWPEITYEKVKELLKNGVEVLGLSTDSKFCSWFKEVGVEVLMLKDIFYNSNSLDEVLTKTMDRISRVLFKYY